MRPKVPFIPAFECAEAPKNPDFGLILGVLKKMAAKIVFLMTMRGVFRPDLPLSFFSPLYRKTPRVL